EGDSPGRKGGLVYQQVSIKELPAPFRAKISHAEITISDLKLPGMAEAVQRQSPSKRGMLRFYSEVVEGRLQMKGLPGIRGVDGDTGAYSGPVEFHLDHQSHSNPSVSGVLHQRIAQEPTCGA